MRSEGDDRGTARGDAGGGREGDPRGVGAARTTRRWAPTRAWLTGRDRADWVAADIREPADARRLVETVIERHGRLDILVNNAGGQYFTPAEGIVAKGWRAVWRLNVEGMLNMARGRRRAGHGRRGGARDGAEGHRGDGERGRRRAG